jgi:ABC-type transporter MlaC component
MSTNSIAAKLGVKSGSNLLMAAAAHLALVKSASTFTRQQILHEMKTASSYYKKTYGNNLTSYLRGAISGGTLIENAENAYALGATARANLEKKLAQ